MSAARWPTPHGAGCWSPCSTARQTRYGLTDPHLRTAIAELARVVLAVTSPEVCVDTAAVDQAEITA